MAMAAAVPVVPSAMQKILELKAKMYDNTTTNKKYYYITVTTDNYTVILLMTIMLISIWALKTGALARDLQGC